MNYKCRFCGYRFKDKDEQICPECLTAREEDISCGIFGEDEHSHEQYDDSYFPDNRFVRSDTFKDGKADFLREERREENRVEAARYERRNGGDINVEATPSKQSYNRTQYKTPQNVYNPNNSKTTKNSGGCGKGCAVPLIILITLGMILKSDPELINTIKEKLEGAVSDTSVSSTASEKKKYEIDRENSLEGVKTVDCDIDAFLTEYNISDIMSDDETLNSFQKKNLFYFENDNWVESTEFDPRELYVVDFTLEFEYSDHRCLESGDVDIKDIYLQGVNSDGNDISYYEGFMSDNLIYCIGDRSNMNPKLLCDKTCDGAYITVDLDYKGQEVAYGFYIDLNEK
ncbi:hypothetical protein [Ruminococcus albus]|uniref:Uncharacterized protein n=1 Tax=Ruminococcus albus TaxID=1264 RepID=A0A1I1DVB8_RUMAL|nr:hypothetical protein [Ruminococcus albus]SFB76968.1 hypothetical protein SAMN02910406_00469 [Ruminococcus albus]